MWAWFRVILGGNFSSLDSDRKQTLDWEMSNHKCRIDAENFKAEGEAS
jgi:hypothetical protein